MQGLSEAPVSMLLEHAKFDDVEVAANAWGGDPLMKRLTQQISPAGYARKLP